MRLGTCYNTKMQDVATYGRGTLSEVLVGATSTRLKLRLSKGLTLKLDGALAGRIVAVVFEECVL